MTANGGQVMLALCYSVLMDRLNGLFTSFRLRAQIELLWPLI